MELTKIHISDIGRIVTGKTPKTSIAENYGGNIPFLTPSDNLLYKSSPKTIKTLTEKGLDEVRNCLLPPHSVCVSCIGSDLGKVVMTIEPTVTNQQFNSIIPNKKFNANFVYYLMILVGRELNYLSKTSTAVPIINKSSFSSYEVEVPNLEIQEKIASILSSLDDKIELNRRINENLEQQAQALFKSWFVDFEPFKDGKFVDSELGKIPEGWQVGQISDFGKIICGKTPSKASKDFYGGNIPFIKIPDMHNQLFVLYSEDSLSYKGSSSQQNKLLPPYSLLVSCIATVGLVSINTKPSHTNQQINSIIPCKSSYLFYLYLSLILMKKKLENMGRGGTATLNVNTTSFGKILVIIPKQSVLDNFSSIVSPLFKNIENLSEQIFKLSQLRDTLLPRLMSGELAITDVNDRSI